VWLQHPIGFEENRKKAHHLIQTKVNETLEDIVAA
jgi:hypothetical protein